MHTDVQDQPTEEGDHGEVRRSLRQGFPYPLNGRELQYTGEDIGIRDSEACEWWDRGQPTHGKGCDVIDKGVRTREFQQRVGRGYRRSGTLHCGNRRRSKDDLFLFFTAQKPQEEEFCNCPLVLSVMSTGGTKAKSQGKT